MVWPFPSSKKIKKCEKMLLSFMRVKLILLLLLIKFALLKCDVIEYLWASFKEKIIFSFVQNFIFMSLLFFELVNNHHY